MPSRVGISFEVVPPDRDALYPFVSARFLVDQVFPRDRRMLQWHAHASGVTMARGSVSSDKSFDFQSYNTSLTAE